MPPTLTVLMGANGAGKSTWRREYGESLPEHFYDADAIAQGLGGHDNPDHQRAARTIVDRFIDVRIARQEAFGLETTYSGRSRPGLVRRAHQNGYACHAIFLGTGSAHLNIARIRNRVTMRTGHFMPREEVERRWHAVQSNLLTTMDLFERITVIDAGAGYRRLFECITGTVGPAEVAMPPWGAELRRAMLEGRTTRDLAET